MYFQNCSTPQQVKDEYLRLAKILHPDVSGKDTTRQFQDMQNAYHARLNELHGYTVKDEAGKSHTYYYSPEREQKMAEIIENLVKANLPDRIVVEVVGTWLWVSGTKKDDGYIRELLKTNEMRWHSKRSRWYWRPNGKKSYFNKTATFSDLKSFYGSEKIKTEKQDRVMVGA